MTKKQATFPPVKVAVLIDGGFFHKRFNAIYNKEQKMTPEEVAGHMYTMAMKHVGNTNTLYRIFYYDCEPLKKKAHNPITHKPVDFSQSGQYKWITQFFEELRQKRKIEVFFCYDIKTVIPELESPFFSCLHEVFHHHRALQERKGSGTED